MDRFCYRDYDIVDIVDIVDMDPEKEMAKIRSIKVKAKTM